MWTYLLIMIIPCLFLTLIAKSVWSKDITAKEMWVALGANVAVAVVSLVIFKGYAYGKMSDVEVWNGYVTSKQQTRVSCSHSYSCNCRQVCSGSGKSRSCSQHCDTCYDHTNDWDWDVHTTVGTFTIDRVDRRGSDEPERFTQVKIGEYAGSMNSYQNPLLADDSTLFITDKSVADRFALPEYPSTFDYYRYNPTIGAPDGYAEIIKDYIKERGVVKQLNIIAVFVTSPPEYFEALMAKWRGGKSNDVIMVFGMTDDGTIKWFNSNSYAKGMNNRPMHTDLRQIALGQKLSKELLTEQLKIIDNKFQRLSREEFEYKKDNIEIPTGLVIFVMFLNLGVCCFVIYFMKENDVCVSKKVMRPQWR